MVSTFFPCPTIFSTLLRQMSIFKLSFATAFTLESTECMVFNAVYQQYFSYITVASAPIHAFLKFFETALRTIFFLSHRLLFHITNVETMDGNERGMNPVAMTIINPWKEYSQSRESNQQPPILKSATLSTELWDSAFYSGRFQNFLIWYREKEKLLNTVFSDLN